MPSPTEEQRRIVELPPDGEHLLVLAAPGSGKTHVIAGRIQRLLMYHAVEPSAVLAMTFTRRAAAELRRPVGNYDVWAGTFHAICADILEDRGDAIGVRRPLRILDEARQREKLIRAIALAGLTLPDQDRERTRFLRELKNRVSRRKRRGLDFDSAQSGDVLDDDLVAPVDDAYCRLCTEADALDYDDLIVRTVELLQSDEETAVHYRRRLRFVFLDEFHDISPEQGELIRLLAPSEAKVSQVMAVADPDQAIYGWRGADATAMLAWFEREYRPRRLWLTMNHRSSGSIVRAAVAVMEGRRRTRPAVPIQPDHHLVACLGYSSLEAEADGLVRLLDSALATGRYRYGDIAVLYRTHKRADAAEASLLRHEVPVWRVQPDRFFDQPEVQEGLRYLELVVSLHDGCFEPALNWPRVLVDELTMVHLRRLAAAEARSLCDLARRIDEYAGAVSPLTRAAIRDFLDTVDRRLAPLVDRSIEEIVEPFLAVMSMRRSPLPRAERANLHGFLDYLGKHLEAVEAALAEAIAAGRLIVLRHAPDGDSAAAACILAHVLDYYLAHPFAVRPPEAAIPGGSFTIDLGVERPVDETGFGLTARRTRTIAYSVGTQAWRLGQMLLLRHERLHNGRFLVFDLETGDRHPSQAEVIEVAALPIEGGILGDEMFESLVRPSGEAAITDGAFNQHGIGWLMVREAPTPAEVLPHLLAFLGEATLVGHNIEDFDYPVLRRIARQSGFDQPHHQLIDTYKMARRLLPGLPSYRLQDLARRLDPTIIQEHRALADARLAARVFCHLLAVQRQEQELDTLSEALPLVALSIRAAAVGVRDENATLVLAGARAASIGQGQHLRANWLAATSGAEAATGEAWLTRLEVDVPEDDDDWRRMIERWRNAIADYCEGTSDHRLPSFLRYAALAQPIDYVPWSATSARRSEPEGQPNPHRLSRSERVAMMTVHAAKGLEWPLVFLLGAEDDQFPGWRQEDEAEGLRVLYVGMTRAKQRLCILWAKQVDGRPRELSRFIRSLPSDVLDRRGG